MSKIDVIRAWKDPKYRATLTAEELASLPENPAGLVELSDLDLDMAGGAKNVAATSDYYSMGCCTSFTNTDGCWLSIAFTTVLNCCGAMILSDEG